LSLSIIDAKSGSVLNNITWKVSYFAFYLFEKTFKFY